MGEKHLFGHRPQHRRRPCAFQGADFRLDRSATWQAEGHAERCSAERWRLGKFASQKCKAFYLFLKIANHHFTFIHNYYVGSNFLDAGDCRRALTGAREEDCFHGGLVWSRAQHQGWTPQQDFDKVNLPWYFFLAWSTCWSGEPGQHLLHERHRTVFKDSAWTEKGPGWTETTWSEYHRR